MRATNPFYGRAVAYAVAVLSATAAAGVRWAFPDELSVTPYLVFYPAVVVSAAWGGFGPGMVATILSLAYVDLLFDIKPAVHLWNDPVSSVRHSLFLLGGVGVAVISHIAIRARASERSRSDKLAEVAERLGQTQHSLQLALEGSGTGVWDWNIETGELNWSQRCREVFEIPPGARMDYSTFLAAVHPEDRERVNGIVHEALRRRKDYVAEMRVVRPDGTVRWIDSMGRAVYDETGRPVRMSGIAMDITDRKLGEEALRQSEERYRLAAQELQAVMDAAPAGICVAQDPECRVITGNRPAHELFGVPAGGNISATPGAMDGLGVVRILKDGREISGAEMPMQVSCSRGEVIRDVELEALRPDGTRRVFLLNSAPLRSPDGKIRGAVGAFTDISDRKRAEEALQQAKAAAEEASRAKDQFLAVLSHELRTPLTPVLATASMLEQDGKLDADVREGLEIIRRNAELEARLIDDLLDVTRIARGKVELDRRPVPICQILRQTVDVCMPDVEARQLKFGVSIRQPPHVVYADSARLQQVFWNLIKNAVKFTPHGGCVGVQCWRESGHVVVEVSDSGEGIEPDALSRIFNAFEQAERAVTRRFGGLGLGLTISKAMVELHGGSITARSEGRGRGATFTVRLPLHEAAGQSQEGDVFCGTGASAVPMAGKLAVSRHGAGRRILLVEDHGDTARVIARVLSRAGHEVKTAGDVAGALALLRSEAFDLLISDLGLPDGSGVDLMRELRESGNQLPGIALSGFGQEEDLSRSREAGFAMHLIKPVSPERLREAIGEALGEMV